MSRASANPKNGDAKKTSIVEPPGLLKTIFDHVGVALAVIDHQRRFVFTNEAAVKMFGATENLSLQEWRSTIYKSSDSQGREILPEHSPILRAFEGETVDPYEVRVNFRDGRSKWLHVAAHPFSIFGLSGVFVIVTDETEQVELRKALERLQHIEEIGILAGGLAHDFNNVLSAVSENVTLALSDEGVPHVTRSRLRQIQAAVKKGAALTQRLTQYSRRRSPQTGTVRINEVVKAALDLVRPLYKGRVRVKTNMSEGLPALQADFARLEQVMVNLIMNAVDAMPDGGKLTIQTELVSASTVLPGKREAGEAFVQVTVADTGIGIPRDLQENIFEPFFTTKPSGKGTGLGLSNARAIVLQHKGHIKVESTPGAGTRFSIYLPVAERSSRITKVAS